MISHDEIQQHVICSFPYGSVTYGIKPTQHSDMDIIAIVDDSLDFSEYQNEIYEDETWKIYGNKGVKWDYQYIRESKFIEMIKEHHIIALESMWLHETLYNGPFEYQKYFTLDKWKLRKTISSIVSNSWAKCHKKLTVEQDYDFYRAIKSLFHCLRLLDFGIQIAKYGMIINYGSANHYWKDLWDNDICPSHKWEDYKAKYQPELNRLKSEFVALCPKPID